ncbi:MAG: hypothetical protein ACK5MP_08950 [Nostocoides sp.]
MSTTKNTQTPEATAAYAAVGVTDLAVEKARALRGRALEARRALRGDLEPSAVQEKVTSVAAQLLADVQALPAAATKAGQQAAARVQEGYADLAVRGERLVGKIMDQKATQDLRTQAEATVSLAKGAATTARHGMAEVERSAKALMTTSRHQVEDAAEAVGYAVEAETVSAQEKVEVAVEKTRTAAKRTATTARKANARTSSRTKAAATSARKTAQKAVKAAETAAENVGR